MKLCILAPVNGITCPPRAYGGIENMAAWLCEGLVKLGHEVTLIAQEGSEIDGVRIQALEPNFEDLHKSDFHQANMADALIGEIDCFHDITHDKQFARRHMRDGIPFIATHQVHSRMGITTNEVCISIAQREHMKLPDYVPVIYNGVPTEEYEFQPDAGKYLLFMGALTRVKGLDNAINIAWLSGWPLKLAGIHWDVEYWDNEITPMLEDEKSKLVGVEFVGEVGGEEKMDLLRNAYAFLYPLRWLEPGGIVVTEALACGVPILGTDSGVLAELVEDKKQGYLVPKGSPRGIVDLASLVPTLQVKIDRAECRARAWWFHSDIMAKDYAALYDRVSGGETWEA